MKSYYEWKSAKDNKLDELQAGSNINFHKMGLAVGDPTTTVSPVYLNRLKPTIDKLMRFKMYNAEKDNPGSTADPGRLRQIQDDFIREMIAAVVHIVHGSDAGAGRTTNLNSPRLNAHQAPQQPPSVNLAAQSMGQGPQLR